MKKMKTGRDMERHLKALSNHYRIEILLYLAKNNGASLEEITQQLKANSKTIGEHTRRLVVHGLIYKDTRTWHVPHSFSPYGKKVVKFLRDFQNF